MLRYVRSAFLFSPAISGLGKCRSIFYFWRMLVLGFGHPGFLLLGLGLEIAYLFSFASNRRFRRLVDSVDDDAEMEDSELRRQTMLTRLKATSRGRLAAQEEKCIKIGQAYHESSAPQLLMVENGKALNKLLWAYLALLLNRDKIETVDSAGKVAGLRQQIAGAESELVRKSCCRRRCGRRSRRRWILCASDWKMSRRAGNR